MMDLFFTVSEFACYCNAWLSFMISYKLFKMETLTFINIMFFIYYFLDSIMSFLETYFLFKLKSDR